MFGCILENIIENIFSTCCSHFLTFSQLLNKYIISFLSPQYKRNKTKEKKSSNPVKLRCDRHGATCGSWVRGATISGLTILGFLGSRSLSLSICACESFLSLFLSLRVSENDLKVKFWLKISSRSKALILRSTEILSEKSIFHAQPNMRKDVKQFPEIVLHQNRRTLRTLMLVLKYVF